MLTIREPIEMVSTRQLQILSPSFENRITANYRLLDCRITAQDLLYLASAASEWYYAEGGTTGIYVDSRQKNVENNYYAVSQVMNRILLEETEGLTYQDRVYITNILQKLGVRDVETWAGQVKMFLNQYRNMNRLVNLYWDNHEVLKGVMSAAGRAAGGAGTIGSGEAGNGSTGSGLTESGSVGAGLTGSRPTGAGPTRTGHAGTEHTGTGQFVIGENAAENNHFPMDQAVYERLGTKMIYEEEAMFQAASRGGSQSFLYEEFQTAAQLWVSKSLFLAELKGDTLGGRQENVPRYENPYEMQADYGGTGTREDVLSQMSSAHLLNLISMAWQSRSEQYESGRQGWLDFTSAVGQTLTDTLERFEYYHSGSKRFERDRMAAQDSFEQLEEEEIELISLFSGCASEIKETFFPVLAEIVQKTDEEANAGTEPELLTWLRRDFYEGIRENKSAKAGDWELSREENGSAGTVQSEGRGSGDKERIRQMEAAEIARNERAAAGETERNEIIAVGEAKRNGRIETGEIERNERAASEEAKRNERIEAVEAERNKRAASVEAERNKKAVSYEDKRNDQAVSGETERSEQIISVETGGYRRIALEEADRSGKNALGEAERNKQTASEVAGRNEQTASGEVGRNEQTASGKAGRNEQIASGEAGRNEQTASGEAGRNEQITLGEAGRNRQIASGEADRNERITSGEAQRNEGFAFGEAERNKQTAYGEAIRNRQITFGEAERNKQTVSEEDERSRQTAPAGPEQDKRTGITKNDQSEITAAGKNDQTEEHTTKFHRDKKAITEELGLNRQNDMTADRESGWEKITFTYGERWKELSEWLETELYRLYGQKTENAAKEDTEETTGDSRMQADKASNNRNLQYPADMPEVYRKYITEGNFSSLSKQLFRIADMLRKVTDSSQDLTRDRAETYRQITVQLEKLIYRGQERTISPVSGGQVHGKQEFLSDQAAINGGYQEIQKPTEPNNRQVYTKPGSSENERFPESLSEAEIQMVYSQVPDLEDDLSLKGSTQDEYQQQFQEFSKTRFPTSLTTPLDSISQSGMENHLKANIEFPSETLPEADERGSKERISISDAGYLLEKNSKAASSSFENPSVTGSSITSPSTINSVSRSSMVHNTAVPNSTGINSSEISSIPSGSTPSDSTPSGIVTSSSMAVATATNEPAIVITTTNEPAVGTVTPSAPVIDSGTFGITVGTGTPSTFALGSTVPNVANAPKAPLSPIDLQFLQINQVETEPQAVSQAKPEAESEVRPRTGPQTSSQARPQASLQTGPEARPQAGHEAGSKASPEPSPKPSPEPDLPSPSASLSSISSQPAPQLISPSDIETQILKQLKAWELSETKSTHETSTPAVPELFAYPSAESNTKTENSFPHINEIRGTDTVQGADGEAAGDYKAIREYLDQIDRKNRGNAHLLDYIKQGANTTVPTVPDMGQTRRDALTALTRPREILQKINSLPLADSRDERRKRIETVLRGTDTVTRYIVEQILSSSEENNIGHPSTMRAVTQEQMIAGLESFINKNPAVKMQFQPSPQKLPPSDQNIQDTVPMIYRRIKTELPEELLEKLTARQSAEVRREVVTQVEKKVTMENVKESTQAEETARKTAKEVKGMVEEGILKQLGPISDKVYQKLEKRLRSEQARRGRI